MQALKRFGQALLSTTVGQVLDKFFQWLKRFILQQIVGRTSNLLTRLIGDHLKKLEETMDAVWDLMKRSGKSLADAMEMIKTITLSKAAEKPTYKTWLNCVGDGISNLATTMVRCFNDSSTGLTTHESFLNAQGRKHAEKRDTTGVHHHNDAATVQSARCKEEMDCNGIIQIIDTGSKLVDYAAKTARVMKYVNGLDEVVTLANHGANHVTNVHSALKEELVCLKKAHQKMTKMKENKSDSAAQIRPSSKPENGEADFAKFKDDVKLEIQKQIGDHILGEIQRSWLKPLVQSKLEKVVKEAGKEAIKGIKTLIEPNDDETNEFARHLNKKLDSLHHDSNWSKHDPTGTKSYEYDGHVNNIGNGDPATVVEKQVAADMLQHPVEIVDETGFYTGNNGQKSHIYYPDGNEQCKKPPIRLKFARNADGTNHATLMMPDGTTHEVPHNPNDPPNRCFYNALAKAKNMETADFLSRFKSFAATDKRAKYLYDRDCHKAYSHLDVGAVAPNYHKDRKGRVTQISCKITRKDLGTGQSFRNDQETNRNMRDKGAKSKDDKGHGIAKDLGGPSDLDNLLPMNRHLNRGEYKHRYEQKLKEFVTLYDQADVKTQSVYLKITVYYYKKEKRPTGFRYFWTSEVEENGKLFIYSSDSGFMANCHRTCRRREASRSITGGFSGINKRLKK